MLKKNKSSVQRKLGPGGRQLDSNERREDEPQVANEPVNEFMSSVDSPVFIMGQNINKNYVDMPLPS